MPDDLLQRLRSADPLAEDVPTPPSLDALGLTIDRLDADRVDAVGSPPSGRQRAPWRATGLSVVIALLVGTGSAAASLTALTGDPLGRTPQVDIEPAAATVRIAAARSADPEGGPAWGVRVGRAEHGLVCVAVGQVQGDELGLVGLDGVFRADRPTGADDCVVPPEYGRLIVQGRTFLGQRGGKSAVSVIYGVVGRAIERVYVEYPDRVGRAAFTTIPIDRSGAFVLAQRGSLRQRSPRFYALVKPNPGDRYRSMTTVDFGRPWTRAEIQAKQRYSWPAGRAKPADGTTRGGTR